MKWLKEGEKKDRIYKLMSDTGEYTGIFIIPDIICDTYYYIYIRVAKNTCFHLDINRHLQLEKAQFFAEKIYNQIKGISKLKIKI